MNLWKLDKDTSYRPDGSIDHRASVKANFEEAPAAFRSGLDYARDALTSERTYRSTSGFCTGMLKTGVGILGAASAIVNYPQAAIHAVCAAFEQPRR